MSFQTGSIKLGGIDLNNSLQWGNRFQWTPIADSVRRTLGGSQVVFTQDLLEGRPITLSATVNTGWLTKAMVDGIQTLANDPLVTRELDFFGELYNVRFLYSGQAPVVFVPLRSIQQLTASDYMIGTIRLYTV